MIVFGASFHLQMPCVTTVELPAAGVPLRPGADTSSAWETAKRYQQSGEDHRRDGNLAFALADFESAAKIMERLVALHLKIFPGSVICL